MSNNLGRVVIQFLASILELLVELDRDLVFEILLLIKVEKSNSLNAVIVLSEQKIYLFRKVFIKIR